MKNLIILTALSVGSLVFGQKKKSAKAPPIKEPTYYPVPEVKEYNYEEHNSEKCFIYKTEETKNSVVYVTENLLQYGGATDNARMVITTYNYDSSKKQQTEKDGRIYSQSESLKYINGKSNLEKGNLNFTPDKKDKFQTRHFKVVYKPKTQKVDFLKDENNHPYKEGKCPEPTISL